MQVSGTNSRIRSELPSGASMPSAASAALKLVASPLTRISNTRAPCPFNVAIGPSAATVPYALAVAADEGRLRDGSVVLMSGFGAGMTWATALYRWRTA